MYRNVRFVDMMENVFSKDNKKDVYIHFDRFNKVIPYDTSEPQEQISCVE